MSTVTNWQDIKNKINQANEDNSLTENELATIYKENSTFFNFQKELKDGKDDTGDWKDLKGFDSNADNKISLREFIDKVTSKKDNSRGYGLGFTLSDAFAGSSEQSDDNQGMFHRTAGERMLTDIASNSSMEDAVIQNVINSVFDNQSGLWSDDGNDRVSASEYRTVRNAVYDELAEKKSTPTDADATNDTSSTTATPTDASSADATTGVSTTTAADGGLPSLNGDDLAKQYLTEFFNKMTANGNPNIIARLNTEDIDPDNIVDNALDVVDNSIATNMRSATFKALGSVLKGYFNSGLITEDKIGALYNKISSPSDKNAFEEGYGKTPVVTPTAASSADAPIDEVPNLETTVSKIKDSTPRDDVVYRSLIFYMQNNTPIARGTITPEQKLGYSAEQIANSLSVGTDETKYQAIGKYFATKYFDEKISLEEFLEKYKEVPDDYKESFAGNTANKDALDAIISSRETQTPTQTRTGNTGEEESTLASGS